MAAHNFSFTIHERFASVVARAIDLTDELRIRYEKLRAALAAVPALA